MKIFANKNIWKKLILVLLAIMIFSVVIPKPVAAKGELVEPVMDLLNFLGDGIVNVVHKIVIEQDATLLDINLETGLWQVFFTVLAVIGAVVAVVALSAGIGWVIAAIAAKGITIASLSIGSILVVSTAAGAWAGASMYNSDFFNGNLVLPIYTITPEEIFKGNIPLFDVNFFEPETKVITPENSYNYNFIASKEGSYTEINEFLANYKYNDGYTENGTITYDEIKNHGVYKKEKEGTLEVVSYSIDKGDRQYEIREEQYSSPKTVINIYSRAVNEEKVIPSYSLQLQSVVSSWYTTLRIVALIGMMSVLVYIGIKILLASSSSQKAKYKQLVLDWLVGMCLLFVMHYGMTFANTFVDKITELINSTADQNMYSLIIELDENEEVVEKALNQAGYQFTENKSETEDTSKVYKFIDKNADGESVTYMQWNTNLMGKLRFDASYAKDQSEGYVGYTILFLVMVMYLIVFVYTYIKRVIYMAFLTLIAPLVALTYPIDKANDGQAQGFNYWIKEYIFNLLLQPMHLLLYTILISVAIELATKQMLYAIIAIGFMVPAEKMLRQMFNFSKANTPGVFGGAAGAALAMSGIRWLMGHGPKGKNARAQGGTSGSDKTKSISGASAEDPVDPVKTFGGMTGSNPISAPGEDSSPTVGISAPGNDSDGDEDSLGVGTDMWGSGYADYNDEGIGYTDEYLLGEQISTIPETPDFAAIPTEIDGARDTKPGDYGFIGPVSKKQLAKKKTINGLKNAGDAYFSGMKDKLYRSIANSDPIGRIGKIGVGALGATALGTLGVAAGVASGDASNVAKYGAAAAAGGAKLGSDAFKSAAGKLQVDGVGEEFERAYLGADEYKKKQAKQKQEAMKKNEEYIKYVEQKMKVDRMKAKKILEEAVPICADSKINSVEDMMKIYKMTQKKHLEGSKKGQNYSYEEAISAYQFDKQYFANFSQTTQKKREEMVKTWAANEFKGYANSEQVARNALRYVERFNEINS